jgi:1-hydroxycarotenoid 3,4-desaturase
VSAPEVIVVGAGVGGLSAALHLAGRGARVRVLEATSSVGGKAGVAVVDGVEVDTGPSVLTLPEVFDETFAAAGLQRRDYLELVESSPAFRYVYADSVVLDVHQRLDATLDSVRAALGPSAASELEGYLVYAARIWEAAAPHFVMADAPDVAGLLFGGVTRLGAVSRIDAFRTLEAAIAARVREPHLRMLLARYATYNGSDARRAPATLGCIAHVELALGGYGVKGGMAELPRALARAAREVGVELELGARVEEILALRGRVVGVRLAGGRELRAPQVVFNADVGALSVGLVRAPVRVPSEGATSMSAHTGILRAARRPTAPRAPHTVLFPRDYRAEFSDLFDAGRVPREPTVYLCAQEACHGRPGWADAEPVFAMVNAPPVSAARERAPRELIEQRVLARLDAAGLRTEGDSFRAWRTPEDLAAAFPGSDGALYGAASNGPASAFRRPANRVKGLPGLYLASGSAHPGGGLPMVALSGKHAARAVLEDAGRLA